jgi:hypothetical protein
MNLNEIQDMIVTSQVCSCFHVLQLMGISVPGLEPELQPVVDHFLPQIISRIKEPHDMQLQVSIHSFESFWMLLFF